MGTSLKKMINSLSSEDQHKVKKRAAELIKEEMTLRELRKLMKMTQEDVAENLHIGQEGISRLEKRSDMMLSTLRKYIHSMGGKIDLVVSLPDKHPIHLSGFCDLDQDSM